MNTTPNRARTPGDLQPVGMWMGSVGKKILRGTWPGMKGGRIHAKLLAKLSHRVFCGIWLE